MIFLLDFGPIMLSCGQRLLDVQTKHKKSIRQHFKKNYSGQTRTKPCRLLLSLRLFGLESCNSPSVPLHFAHEFQHVSMFCLLGWRFLIVTLHAKTILDSFRGQDRIGMATNQINNLILYRDIQIPNRIALKSPSISNL